MSKDLTELGATTNKADNEETLFVYSFLTDAPTIDFIKQSKVMFINRGLQGSGKSTLTRSIAEVYGIERTVICASDDYFVDPKTNEYKWDFSKLIEAHKWAENKAEQACRESQSPVIIDKTNVKFLEVKLYVDMARRYNYIPLIVEPQTWWKFDLDSLAKRNKHNVPIDVILKKLREYATIEPFYYGWFLNEAGSIALDKLAFEVLNKACEVIPNFKKHLESTTSAQIDKLYVNRLYHNGLHCTTAYCGNKLRRFNPKASDENVKEIETYIKNPLVCQSIGQVTRLEMRGLSITPNTIAIHISLNDENQKLLWYNDHDEAEIRELVHKDAMLSRLDHSTVIDSLKENIQYLRAHVTIALAQGVEAKVSGDELITLLLRLKLAKFNSSSAASTKDYDLFNTDDYRIASFRDSFCYVKFKRPKYIYAIFNSEI